MLHHSILPLDPQNPEAKHFVLTFLTRAGISFTPPLNRALAETPDISYEVQGTEDFKDTFFGRFPLRVDEIPAVTGSLAPAPAGYEYHSFRLPAPVAEMPKGFMRVEIF